MYYHILHIPQNEIITLGSLNDPGDYKGEFTSEQEAEQRLQDALWYQKQTGCTFLGDDWPSLREEFLIVGRETSLKHLYSTLGD